ncbi:hypothetical protein ABZP36_024065 [Zizania latifolia]
MSETGTCTLHLQAVAFVVLLLRLAPVTQASVQQLPGCPDKCGDINVPYPFGIGARCARDSGFELTCDQSYSSPRLLSRYGQHLVKLSLADGEAIALLNATRQCYNSTEDLVFVDSSTQNYMPLDGSTYRFSAARNRFVALGCPNLGYFVDSTGYYLSGCTSICRPVQSRTASSGGCTGEGCCQIKIPQNMDYYEQHILSFKPGQGDPIFQGDKTYCRYVFLADEKWIETTYRDRPDFNRTDDFTVHVVIDWAIRNVGNCNAAKLNKTADYACRYSHSDCVNSTNGAGYRCNCFDGYKGNPFPRRRMRR